MTRKIGVYYCMTTPSYTPTKRLNLKLSPAIDKMLREIGEKTGLKLVTVISQGIEHEYREWRMAGWKTGGCAKEGNP